MQGGRRRKEGRQNETKGKEKSIEGGDLKIKEAAMIPFFVVFFKSRRKEEGQRKVCNSNSQLNVSFEC